MHSFVTGLLQCPACRGTLQWEIQAQREGCIEEAEATCSDCGARYVVHEGIGAFLTPDLQRNDLWQDVDSQLHGYLDEHPQVARQLLDSPLESLGPVDQFYRGQALEERGDWVGAKAAAEVAERGLYTPEYVSAYHSQLAYVVEHAAVGDGPLVDLASGRGALVDRLASLGARPIIATDFSLRVLRRDQRWLEFLGLAERVSLLAFDARRTPFKNGAIATLTTNLGLQNIEQPGELMRELRRVVRGALFAVCYFCPPDDVVNGEALRRLGLHEALVRQLLLQRMQQAGWQVQVANSRQAHALPTPTSALLEGAGIDGFPVAETVLEWCVVQAM